MKLEYFKSLLEILIHEGYESEINWQRKVKPVESVEVFCSEAAWVILNSGMKEQIARIIWNRIKAAWEAGKPTGSAFGHNGKVAAIDYINDKSYALFHAYKASDNKVKWLQSLPYIGKITCWHLAKNYGEDVVKPDRHLVRIANYYNMTPDELCEKLSKETGEKKCVVDIVLWRAANLGLLSDAHLQAYDPK